MHRRAEKRIRIVFLEMNVGETYSNVDFTGTCSSWDRKTAVHTQERNLSEAQAIDSVGNLVACNAVG